MARLSEARIVVIGVGGVGSWCAEALVRTGARHLVLVDDDLVAPSNVNRQCPATAKNLGRSKVEAMCERLHEINPDCEVIALKERYEGNGAGTFNLRNADIVVDAIDSVDCKADLILNATATGVPIVSSMGAALRLDPTRIVLRRFDKVQGDGLARALRHRFRKLGRFPNEKFICVCSEEPPVHQSDPSAKGSLMPVTCAFGMALATEAIRQLTGTGLSNSYR